MVLGLPVGSLAAFLGYCVVGVRGALSSLPAKFGLLLASVLVVGVLASYYVFRYYDCTWHRQFREQLHQEIGSAHRDGQAFRLAQVTDFQWDRVRISPHFMPPEKVADCPFGWDWSGQERRTLAENGNLAILIFSVDDQVVSYAELRNDWADFSAVAGSWSPESAVFNVRKSFDGLQLEDALP